MNEYKFFPIGCKVVVDNYDGIGIVKGYLNPNGLDSKLPSFYIVFPDGDGDGYELEQICELAGEKVGKLIFPE